MLHQGSSQNCDDLKSQLKEITDARAEAVEKCVETKNTELSELNDSTEFAIKRKAIEDDIATLTDSLHCDDSVLAEYFKCHTDKVSTNVSLIFKFY